MKVRPAEPETETSLRRRKVLLFATHVVPYAVPVYRLLAGDPRIDFHVVYLTDPKRPVVRDREFGEREPWDLPLLEGYDWQYLPNRAFRGGIERFWGLVHPQVYSLIRNSGCDAVLISGYAYASLWGIVLSARLLGVPVLLATDSTQWSADRSHPGWLALKRRLLPRIYSQMDGVVVVSSRSRRFLESLRVPPARIHLSPYSVDNERFQRDSLRADRGRIRRQWGIPDEASVILYSGKLIPRKRPGDLLLAMERLRETGAWLVFAGSGPLRRTLEDRAARSGIERCRFLGFVNQSALPGVYASADVAVLPSEREAFGLVANEAMLCGLPVVVSDQVGAGDDLVQRGVTGEVYPVGDIGGLTEALRPLLVDPERRKRMGRHARERMRSWSPREASEGIVSALQQTVSLPRHG